MAGPPSLRSLCCQLALQIHGVAGAGQSVPAVLSMAAGGLFSIYGSDFAAVAAGRQMSPTDITNNTLPTDLAQTCVRIGDAMAPLTYVSRVQINAMATALPGSGVVPVSVVANCGTDATITSAAVMVVVASAAPEFLSFAPSPDGNSPVTAIQNATGAYVGPVGLIPVRCLRPLPSTMC